MEAYPVATARRFKRVMLFTLTGNIGHDLYNGLLEVFVYAPGQLPPRSAGLGSQCNLQRRTQYCSQKSRN